MTLDEMLKLADDLVFAKTGQHLNDLQEKIVRGTIQGETYEKIAEDFHCNESYVRDIGSKLWHIFSEALGEEVNKSNLRSAMQRLQVSLFSNVVQDHVQVNTINFCKETGYLPNVCNSYPPNQKPQTVNHKLSEMPELGVFYDRTSELETLKTWILQESCRLITLTGISGIGKTKLTVKLIQEIKQNFEYILWYNLDNSSTFSEFKAELQELFSQLEETDLTVKNGKRFKPIKYLQKHRSLIVIDNIHYLFCRGQVAGEYKPECEEFSSFFKQIEELSHQSCVILLGWEQPREVAQVKSKANPIKNLTLRGLETVAAKQLLQDQGLTEDEQLTLLVDPYQGNPLWLKYIATSLLEVGVSIRDIINNETLFIPQTLKKNL